MSLIIPYSSIASPTCSSYKAPTAANFATLKHLFKFDQGSLGVGSCAFTDTINGAVMSNATATATDNGDGTVTLSAALATFSGSWVAPGTKKALVIVLGKPDTATCSFLMGSVAASGHGYRLVAASATSGGVNAGGAAVVTAGANYLVGSGATTAQAYATVFDFNSATGITQYKFDGTTQSSTAAAGDTATNSGGLGLTSVDAAVGLGATWKPALIAVLHLDNTPSASFVQSMLAWMHYNTFTNLRKNLYPGLADLS